MIKSQSSTHLLVLITSILGIFVVAQAVSTWDAAQSHPWAHLNTDHHVLGSIHYKNENPDSFSKDYVLANEESYDYYTPSFVLLIQRITELTDETFLNALALLQGPILFLFLLASYFLFQQQAGSSMIGIVVALLSISGYFVLKDSWEIVGLERILARTIALPVVMLATFTFFRIFYLGEHAQPWLWIVTGLLLGIIANIHPPTGIAFAPVLGMTTLLGWQCWNGKKLRNLGLLVGGAIITGMPIIIHTLFTTGSTEIPDFQAFAATYADRVAMFPFTDAFRGRIALLLPRQQLAFGFAWFPLTLLSWIAIKSDRRSWTVWPFILVQVAYCWLLIAQYYNVHFNAIAIITLFYFWRWWRKDEGRDLIWLYFLASIIFASYFLAVAFRAVWLTFEIDAVTTLVSQLPRGAQLLTLPVLLIGTRLASDLLMRWKSLPSKSVVWIEFLVVIALALFRELSGVHLLLVALLVPYNRLPEWQARQLVFFVMWSGLSALAAAWLVVGNHLLVPVLAGIIVSGGIWLSSRADWGTRSKGLGAVVVLLIVAVFVMVEPSSDALDAIKTTILTPPSFLVAAVVTGAGVFLLFDRLDDQVDRRLPVYILVPLLIITGFQLLDATGVLDLLDEPVPDRPPEYVVGEWARQNTPPDALFFTSNMNGAAFRFWSRRSIVMSHKDLGMFVAFSRSDELAALTERWQRLDGLRGDEIIADPEAAQADYIIIPAEDELLSLPVVYQYEDAIVYRLDHEPGESH